MNENFSYWFFISLSRRKTQVGLQLTYATLATVHTQVLFFAKNRRTSPYLKNEFWLQQKAIQVGL